MDYFVYIVASRSRVIYTGVTSDLRGRVYQHKEMVIKGFSSKYRTTSLVHFESTPDVYAAIAREKEIKKWRREKKVKLIELENPEWNDLSADWYSE